MYNYNSIHKIIVVSIVLVWTMFQFQSRKTEELNYEDGSYKRTGELKNGLNHGLWTWYFPNGQVQMKGNFEMGQREGVWQTFDSLGNLRVESYYIDNKLNGKMLVLSEKGDTVSVKEFRDDEVIGY